MMKKLCRKWLACLVALLPLSAIALEFDEIREFGDVFSISAQAKGRDTVEISWDIAEQYYLYNNKFLTFKTDTPDVVLGAPVIPKGERKFDELLGEEVITFHQNLTVVLPLENVPDSVNLLALRVRSQGCLENVLCYPPTEQIVSVTLPDPVLAPSKNPIADIFNQADRSSLGQDAVYTDPALPPELAFTYEAIELTPDTILARFTAQPGYYLYKDKFTFRISGGDGFEIRDVKLVEGTIKDDPEFGPVEVYFDQVEVPLRLNRPAGKAQNIVLEAGYQGCRNGDICYPPQSKGIELSMSASTEAVNEASESTRSTTISTGDSDSGADNDLRESEQDVLARMLLNNPAGAMLAFFVAGLLLAFTPCVLPMIPILSGIIAGQGERMTGSRAFWLSLVYVLAMAVTYTVAGVLAGLFGKNLQAVFQNPWILGFFIAIFIALALSMFGFFELQLPSSLQSRLTSASNRQKGGNLFGVAIMGFLSALIVGPCVAPPLAAALIVIGASGSAALGGFALFALSMGMGVPLILFGVSAGKLVPRAGAWMETIKAGFGIGLLALAIWMLERIIQGPVILVLWGVLAISIGVYLGALERIPEGASGWRRLWKSLGLVFLLLGAIEIIGAATGHEDWTRPLKQLRSADQVVNAEHVTFKRIKSIEDLNEEVARANQSGKPAMLDFYADWCIECVRMERNTFPEPEIQSLLKQIQPLQADVTANDDTDQALMKKYGVIGPPAILFFDRNGNELRSKRLVGYFEPDEFAGHLEKVLN